MPEAISGEVVKPSAELDRPFAADVRYDDGEPAVTRVVVHVEYSDGTVHEWDASDPQDFELHDGFSTRTTGLAVGGGGGFTPVRASVPSLRLSFKADPRRNMFQWTSAKLIVSDAMRGALEYVAESMGGRLSWLPGNQPKR